MKGRRILLIILVIGVIGALFGSGTKDNTSKSVKKETTTISREVEVPTTTLPNTDELTKQEQPTIVIEKPTTQVVVTEETTKAQRMVWVPTNGGTKYHSKSSCSSMKNPIQVTIEEAKNMGFTACGRCKPGN